MSAESNQICDFEKLKSGQHETNMFNIQRLIIIIYA